MFRKMTEITFHDWILECDVDATRETYQKVSQGSAEICDCIYCKNFLILRDNLFQGEFLELLNNLGVDYRKDVEIYLQATLEKGKHLYAGWFHSIGKVKQNGNVVILKNELQVYFMQNKDLMFDEFEGKDLIQIEFVNAVLPWKLIDLPEPKQ